VRATPSSFKENSLLDTRPDNVRNVEIENQLLKFCVGKMVVQYKEHMTLGRIISWISYPLVSAFGEVGLNRLRI